MANNVNLSPSKEQFCSFISEFIDKSKDIIMEKEDILDYDAVELTLLLKSIGFRLTSLEFNGEQNNGSNEIEIEIKCKQSGIDSKMQMISKKCTCPNRKSENNNSFWEVQGIDPKTMPSTSNSTRVIQDSSCNLLPDISKKTQNLSRVMLTVLLQHFNIDAKSKEKLKTVDINEILNRLQNHQLEKIDPIKTESTEETIINEPSKNVQVQTESSQEAILKNIPAVTLNQNQPLEFISPKDKNVETAHCSTPLSSINITPVPLYDNHIATVLPKINLNNTDTDIDSNKKIEKSLNIDNLMELNGLDRGDNFEHDANRDIFIIQHITEARKQLDFALLMLKCNLTTTLSNANSPVLTVTPQNLNKKKSNVETAKGSINIGNKLKTPSQNSEINRRHSFSARPNEKPNSLLKPAISVDTKRKSFGTTPILNKFLRPATPRPIGDQKGNDTLTKRSGTTNSKQINLVKTSSKIPSNLLKKNAGP